MLHAEQAFPCAGPLVRVRSNTKLGRILHALAAGKSLNRFQAEHLGDHCLHSTVSAIERRYGLRVDRREETVPGYAGHRTRVMRYQLDSENRKRAIALLGKDQCAAA